MRSRRRPHQQIRDDDRPRNRHRRVGVREAAHVVNNVSPTGAPRSSSSDGVDVASTRLRQVASRRSPVGLVRAPSPTGGREPVSAHRWRRRRSLDRCRIRHRAAHHRRRFMEPSFRINAAAMPISRSPSSYKTLYVSPSQLRSRRRTTRLRLRTSLPPAPTASRGSGAGAGGGGGGGGGASRVGVGTGTAVSGAAPSRRAVRRPGPPPRGHAGRVPPSMPHLRLPRVAGDLDDVDARRSAQ